MTSLLRGVGRQLIAGTMVLLAFTVLLGGGYTAAVWGLSRMTSTSAEGSILRDDGGCPVGSALIGVDLTPPPGRPDGYLHARVAGGAADPMAAGDPADSGASNLGPNSEELRTIVVARRAVIAAREDVAPSRVPPDAVTRSGSSLDPDISPAYAEIQVPRLARVHHLPEDRVRALIAVNTQGRQWGFLGSPRVNVLRVNLALGNRVAECGGPRPPHSGR